MASNSFKRFSKMFALSLLSMAFFETLGIANAAPVPATGTTTLVLQEYSGTTSGVTLDINGTPYPTGTISYSLDTSYGSDNFYKFDWDSLTASIQLHLEADSPGLTQLGINSVPILIEESGSFSAAPLVEPDQTQEVQFPQVTFLGGGTIDEGPLAGVKFTNQNIHPGPMIEINTGPIASPTIEVSPTTQVNVNSSHTGSIQQGNIIQNTGGNATGMVSGIPEPETYAMFLAGLGLMSAIVRRKQTKTK